MNNLYRHGWSEVCNNKKAKTRIVCVIPNDKTVARELVIEMGCASMTLNGTQMRSLRSVFKKIDSGKFSRTNGGVLARNNQNNIKKA